jgi:ATP-dependent Clp protease adaptor protein ClpS
MTTLAPALPDQDIRSDSARIPPYKVILLDDPITTMEFVVDVLMRFFQKDPPTATRLMWEVHTTGASHVATLPLEQAEMKQSQVHQAAKSAGYPFRCVVEPA